MSPLDHIYAPDVILTIKGLSLREKLLLSLVVRFGKKGLTAGNAEIARLLDVTPTRVSELLSNLEQKGYVEIENRQSRHRKVYFRPNSKVRATLLSTESESKNSLLSTLDESTFDGSRNIIEEGKEEEVQSNRFAFVLKSMKLWYLPQDKLGQYKGTYPRLDVEHELRKASQWLVDHPKRRKTAGGMLDYIGGWLGRAKPDNNGQVVPEATEEQIEAAMQEVLA